MNARGSKIFSRARALYLIAQKKHRRSELLKEGKNEGLYIEHRLAKTDNCNKDINLSKSYVLSIRRLRKGRNCFEKQYYVVDAFCMIHKGIDSIVLTRLNRFNRNHSPCLLCMSSNDVLGIASIRDKIKRDTLYARTRRGLSASEAVSIAYRKKAFLENKTERKPAIRNKSHFMRDLSVYEKFQAKINSYAQEDPRREKLKKLLINCDFSEAVIIRKNSITNLTGIKCNLHPYVKIEKKQFGRLLEGANPCPRCKLELRSKVSKGKHRLRWTVDRVRSEVERNAVLQNSLSKFNLSFIKVGALNKGGRNCSHVFEIKCNDHETTVPPILVTHFLNGKVFCPKCPSRSAYTKRQADRMLFEAHGSTISLVKFGGGITVSSTYKCNICGETWDAALNNVIGHISKKTYRRPTGCPKCSSTANISENNVSIILDSLGFSACSVMGSYIDMVLPFLRGHSKSYARLVGVKRNTKRELRVDYIVNTGKQIYAIEVDGPQHYGMRYLNYGHEEFHRVAQLDAEKVKVLVNDFNIIVCRLPLPLFTKKESIRVEIEKITNNCPTWTGVPNKKWIEQVNHDN